MKRRVFLQALAAQGLVAACGRGPAADAALAGPRPLVIFLEDTEARQTPVQMRRFHETLLTVGLLPDAIALEASSLAGSEMETVKAGITSLVRLRPAAFMTVSTDIARHGLPFMRDIPLIMATAAEPDRVGLGSARGPRTLNVTGFTYNVPSEGKPFEVLADAFPWARRVAIITDPDWQRLWDRDAELAALRSRFGLRVDVVVPDYADNLRRDLAAKLHPDVDACYVPRSDVVLFKLPPLIDYLVNRRLAHLFALDEAVHQGALLTYAARRHSHWEPMAVMLRDVLAGSIARDVPFERPRDFVLGVNAHQAVRMGIKIPKNILRRANVVV